MIRDKGISTINITHEGEKKKEKKPLQKYKNNKIKYYTSKTSGIYICVYICQPSLFIKYQFLFLNASQDQKTVQYHIIF